MRMQPDTHWGRRLDFTVPRRRDDIHVQVIDGEAVLFDSATGCTHRLNATALTVWRACDGRLTTRHVAEQLVDGYDVSLDRARMDVEQLVAALAHADLLDAGESP